MAFQELKTLDADTTISLGGVNRKTNKANPTKIEGYYLGSKTVADQKKKSGVSYIHILQTPKGNVGVWGKTNLDNKLKGVTPGFMVRITQNGMQKTPNGEMYLYKVELDKDNSVDVSDLSANHNDGGYVADSEVQPGGDLGYTDDATFGEDDQDLDQDATPPDEVTPQRPAANARPTATAPDAARQAKVQAMLAGKGGARKTA